MDLESIRGYFSADIEAVDVALRAYLSRSDDPHAHYGMLRYHLGFARESLETLVGPPIARGKRLRPLACMLICRALGAPPKAVERLMVASEIMHAATLAHDDVQDEDPIRWGRPTLWSLFGIGQAINAGDALIGMTYELLLDLPESGVPNEVAMRVLQIYNQAHLRMCEGQHLDLLYRDRLDVGVAAYLDMISRKTAAATECVAHAAALLAAHDARLVSCYRRFGKAFGMLYQICDDIRAVWVEPKEKEKLAGNDVRMHKLTLPLLYGMQQGSPRLRELMARAGQSPDAVIEIGSELRRLGVEARCREHAIHHRNEAIAMLEEAGVDSPAQKLLEMMVQMCARSAGIDEQGSPAAAE